MATVLNINGLTKMTRQKKFGKAVLAIASQNAKELHKFFIFNFGVQHICILPDTQKNNSTLNSKIYG